MGSVPRSGRSPGRGNGNPLQYFCLENSTDRGTWWAANSPQDRKELGTIEMTWHAYTQHVFTPTCAYF